MRYTYDDDLSDQRKKIMFKLKNNNFDKLRDKKVKGFMMKNRPESVKNTKNDDVERLRDMCKKANIAKGLISAKSKISIKKI